jgi:argininosuccinate lyase
MGVKKEARLRGRFKEEIDEAVQNYLASAPYDWRLYRHDILGSQVHAEMLARQKIITRGDYVKIKDGLHTILKEIEGGRFQFKLELEDIHMNIESRLFELIGDTAGKLHTARSRNDQVALDIRLFAREAAGKVVTALQRFNSQLVYIAEKISSLSCPDHPSAAGSSPCFFTTSWPISRCSAGTSIGLKAVSAASISCPWAAGRWPVCLIRWTGNSSLANWDSMT